MNKIYLVCMGSGESLEEAADELEERMEPILADESMTVEMIGGIAIGTLAAGDCMNDLYWFSQALLLEKVPDAG